MPSVLDRKFDAVLQKVIGEGGRIQIGRDAEGRAIVTNLPPTLPMLFDAFADYLCQHRIIFAVKHTRHSCSSALPFVVPLL